MNLDVAVNNDQNSSRAGLGSGRREWLRAGRLTLLAGASLLAGLVGCAPAVRLAGFSFHLPPRRVQLGWPRSLAALGDESRADSALLWVRTKYPATLAHARAERPVFAFLGDSCTEY